MKSSRLEAFSDGVMAIIITIMVLELKMPEGSDFNSLKTVAPHFISYIISFIYVGIYWNNHHHLFQAVEKVNGKILWANSFLLFCLSLLPLTTSWMGEHVFSNVPVFIYGLNLLLCAIAFIFLVICIVKLEGKDSKISQMVGNKKKEYLSTAIYFISMIFAFYFPIISLIGYACVAMIWLIPDRRVERNL